MELMRAVERASFGERGWRKRRGSEKLGVLLEEEGGDDEAEGSLTIRDEEEEMDAREGGGGEEAGPLSVFGRGGGAETAGLERRGEKGISELMGRELGVRMRSKGWEICWKWDGTRERSSSERRGAARVVWEPCGSDEMMSTLVAIWEKMKRVFKWI